MNNRINRDYLCLQIAKLIALRGTCKRAQVGTVIAINGRIISTGYNGAPSGLPHCIDWGCIIGVDGGCIRTSHAEAGAIAFAARRGLSLEGATLYCTLSPCLNCAKLIINSGIKEVIYCEKYKNHEGLDLLDGAGIVHHHMEVQDA